MVLLQEVVEDLLLLDVAFQRPGAEFFFRFRFRFGRDRLVRRLSRGCLGLGWGGWSANRRFFGCPQACQEDEPPDDGCDSSPFPLHDPPPDAARREFRQGPWLLERTLTPAHSPTECTREFGPDRCMLVTGLLDFRGNPIDDHDIVN